jgi:hypothetical protein
MFLIRTGHPISPIPQRCRRLDLRDSPRGNIGWYQCDEQQDHRCRTNDCVMCAPHEPRCLSFAPVREGTVVQLLTLTLTRLTLAGGGGTVATSCCKGILGVASAVAGCGGHGGNGGSTREMFIAGADGGQASPGGPATARTLPGFTGGEADAVSGSGGNGGNGGNALRVAGGQGGPGGVNGQSTATNACYGGTVSKMDGREGSRGKLGNP